MSQQGSKSSQSCMRLRCPPCPTQRPPPSPTSTPFLPWPCLTGDRGCPQGARCHHHKRGSCPLACPRAAAQGRCGGTAFVFGFFLYFTPGPRVFGGWYGVFISLCSQSDGKVRAGIFYPRPFPTTFAEAAPPGRGAVLPSCGPGPPCRPPPPLRLHSSAGLV